MGGLDLLEWGTVRERTRIFYDQYRAVLEADVEHRNYDEMEREVARTRRVVASGAYRGPILRKEGLGSQYIERQQGPVNAEGSE